VTGPDCVWYPFRRRSYGVVGRGVLMCAGVDSHSRTSGSSSILTSISS